VIANESPEVGDDIRDLFADLAATLEQQHRAFSGEYRPALDVRETETAVEVLVDVAGVPPEAIRVLVRAGIVIVAGEKAATPPGRHQTFHLVEREFGRFARAVRVAGACDITSATATIVQGELLVTLPKRSERRGHAHRIPVTASSAT
jgi:HSP20 family protein